MRTNHEDYTAITQLVARFDDAANRRDAQEFASLWDQDAAWEIGDPMPMRVSGARAIVEKWREMIDGTQWLFRGSFAGVIALDGEVATGRWPCVETGTFSDNTGYDNRALYEDKYVRREGRWLFKQRRYVYLWLSRENLPGRYIKH
jgi:ketosteroid isomerase-like protein